MVVLPAAIDGGHQNGLDEHLQLPKVPEILLGLLLTLPLVKTRKQEEEKEEEEGGREEEGDHLMLLMMLMMMMMMVVVVVVVVGCWC